MLKGNAIAFMYDQRQCISGSGYMKRYNMFWTTEVYSFTSVAAKNEKLEHMEITIQWLIWHGYSIPNIIFTLMTYLHVAFRLQSLIVAHDVLDI